MRPYPFWKSEFNAGPIHKIKEFIRFGFHFLSVWIGPYTSGRFGIQLSRLKCELLMETLRLKVRDTLQIVNRTFQGWL